jgi:hypothetical protein
VINLNTTGDGIALYKSLGFTEPRYPVSSSGWHVPALSVSAAEASGCLGPEHIAGLRVDAVQC